MHFGSKPSNLPHSSMTLNAGLILLAVGSSDGKFSGENSKPSNPDDHNLYFAEAALKFE